MSLAVNYFEKNFFQIFPNFPYVFTKTIFGKMGKLFKDKSENVEKSGKSFPQNNP